VSIVDDLKNSIHKLFRTRENSYATHADRRMILNRFAEDLVSSGFGLRNINGIKQKHVFVIVKYWQAKNLSVATIKNRMAVLRNLCEKINKKILFQAMTD